MSVIQILHIILLTILVKWSHCLVLDPICQSCLQIDSTLVSSFYSPQFSSNLTMFTLPGFSFSKIVVDFRHLSSFPINLNNQTIFNLTFVITDTSSQTQTIQFINDTIIGVNVYELEATSEQTLVIYFVIDDEYKQFEYMLRETISINMSYSNNRISNEDSSYVFVVYSTDVIFYHIFVKQNINLPDNKPDLNNMKNYYLQNQYNSSSFQSTTVYSQTTLYWNVQFYLILKQTDSQFAVPYFPYFANCQWQGDMMYIMQMLQNGTDCNLVELNQTQGINQFKFGSSAVADQCWINRQCTVSGDYSSTEYPYWLTLAPGISLFQISQQKIPWSQFSYNMNFDSSQLVPCTILTSMGSNTSGSYPLRVKLALGYYQVSITQKQIIQCTVQYDLYVTATTNFTYQLQIHSYPMNHTNLLLSFTFSWYVYMIVFVIVGVIEVIENGMLWVYHYFVAEQRRPIKVMVYMRVIKQILKGMAMALVIQLVVVVVICAIMNAKMFQTPFYDTSNSIGSSTPRVLFDYILQQPISNYDSTQMQNLRAGRMGIAFITIGIFVMIYNSKYFVGKSKKKQQERDFKILGRTFKPLEWVQGKFLFVTFIYIILLIFLIDFAYSQLYSNNIWTFILIMKVLQVILEQITKDVFDDMLPGTPFKIITDIIGFLNTLSAANLYDFLFGSLIDVAGNLVQKIYLFKIQKMVGDTIKQKYQQLEKFYINFMNEQDGDDDDQANGRSEKQNEEIGIGEDGDNQQVFIYREAQEVEFFEEEVKQTYNFSKIEQETQALYECKQTQEQRKLKKRYFESLSREFKYQRQLLLNRQEGKVNSSEKSKVVGNIIKSNGKIDKQKHNNKTNNIEKRKKPTTITKSPIFNNQLQQQYHQQQQQMNDQQRQQMMQQQSEIFQVLMDLMGIIYTYTLNPFIVFLLWIIYDQSQILANYGMTYSTVILYLLSALVIGIFSVINIILVFSMVENYIVSMQFEGQINDLLRRFDIRKTFWKADQDQLNDQKLIQQMLGADQYCLSSQLFFVLTIYIGSMFAVIIGIAIVYNTGYNAFQDVATIPVILFWVGFLELFTFIIKKIGICLNVWNYKKYKQAMSSTKEGGNLNGIINHKQLEEMMQENSDFKTQNIIFAPIEELPKFKRFFNTPKKKIINHSNDNDKNIQLKQFNGQIEKNSSQSSDQSNQITITTKKKRIKTHPNLQLDDKHQHQQIILAQKRIQTICKKLQPLFSKQSFRLEYCKNNTQFIKQNIEKILPLVDYLPELQQFKNILPTGEKNAEIGTGNSWQSQLKTSQKKRHQSTSTNNMDPVVTEMILEWLRTTEKLRQKRIMNGLQTQNKVNYCSFCYQTWGLYYGQGSTCLSCSMKINKLNNQKQHKFVQKKKSMKPRLIKNANETYLRNDKKRKTTKKKNKLNIIAQEQDFDDDDDSDQIQSDDNSEDQIHKSNSKKKHHRR